MTDTLRVALAQTDFVVGDIGANEAEIRRAWAEARDAGDALVVFPEMAVSGYPPQDLVQKPAFIAACEQAVRGLAEEFAAGPAALVGAPALIDGALYNAVWLLDGGAVRGVCRKWDLANTGAFDEKRQFTPGPEAGPIDVRGVRVGVLIGEDAWSPHLVETMMESGAEILISVNGSPYERGKYEIDRVPRMVARVVESGAPLAYLNLVGAQDELVFDGGSFALDQGGALAAQAPFFERAQLRLNFQRSREGWRCASAQEEAKASPPGALEADYRAMVESLRGFTEKTSRSGAALLLDGGVSALLSLVLAMDALGSERVAAIVSPNLETADRQVVERFLQACGVEAHPAPAALKGSAFAKGSSALRARLEALCLCAEGESGGALTIGSADKTALALAAAPPADFNPLQDVYRSRVGALLRWRLKQLRPWMRGPAAAASTEREALLEQAEKLSGALSLGDDDAAQGAPAEKIDAVLELLVEGEASLAEIVAEGHDRALAERVEKRLALSEPWRRQTGPGPKLGPRAFGLDRRYPIANRWRDKA